MTRMTNRAIFGVVFAAGLTLLATAPLLADQSADETPTAAPAAPEASPNLDQAVECSDAGPGCCQRRREGWRRSQDESQPAAETSAGERGCQCQRGGCARGRGRGFRGGSGEDSETFGRGPAAGGRRGQGRGQGQWQGAGRGRGGKRAEMETYRELLANHESIERTFENIPGGIRSFTTTDDPELVPVLRRHLKQVTGLLEGGGWIRIWDPLFAEIFEHADKIETTVKEIEGGVEVTETSDDEQVAALIRAHAAKVMEFVDRGQEAYDEPTPLPEGYQSPE